MKTLEVLVDDVAVDRNRFVQLTTPTFMVELAVEIDSYRILTLSACFDVT
jgi:hypothetical protein